MTSSNHWQEIRTLWKAAEERPVATRHVVQVLRRHFHEAGIVERMAAFEDFVRQTSIQGQVNGFRWGATDCSLMVADWCLANGHDDPAASWRGQYGDEASCRALVAERGDLVAVLDACAISVGLKRIHEPEFGCVAVVGSKSNAERQWAAIWNGARWAVWLGNADGVQWQPMMAKGLTMWRV
ncbi:hypothetical protein [Devosia sp.]|uniref:DUF6950 family protein n=1 Tax=Devosia sp. TaxID=1871048 RepID=UPI001B261F46|nr:hypothetical protein [Devosia sp.]MBO9589525.1 hypothetical protein [Devosia sp.]